LQFQLADLYECLCDAGPDAEVVVAGDRRLSRSALDRRANRLAHHLEREGVGPGDHVGIYAFNRLEWIEALLACWKLRAAAVNVNYRYVTDELRYLWGNSDMVALVYERGFSEPVAALAEEFPALRSHLVLEDGSGAAPGPGRGYEAALAAQPESRGFGPRSGSDLYLVYTGGTTGMPKGVLWRHEDLFLNIVCALLGEIATPEEIATRSDNPHGMRTLTLSPLMHGGGQWPFLITVLSGGVGLFPVSRTFDPHEVLSIIEKERVTTLSIIGDAMGRPLAEARLGADRDTSSLLAISTGGAICTAPVRDLLRRGFGKVFVTGGIGSSEIGHAARETQSFDPHSGPRFRLGKTVAVLGDDLEPIPPGSDRIGRLARSGHIPLGYYQDEKKTAEAFVTDARGTRWVLPGDYARVESDGSITLLGRGSQCINSGGEKIFPDEVEAVISGHPAVRHSAVIGVPDPVWQERVVALVEPMQAGGAPDLAEIQRHCRRHLAGYKVPRALVITRIERTASGKVDCVWARALAETTLAREGAGLRGVR
jgi:acyl-CoA synthetase (AMP-forming)/AMP-acid ligase II